MIRSCLSCSALEELETEPIQANRDCEALEVRGNRGHVVVATVVVVVCQWGVGNCRDVTDHAADSKDRSAGSVASTSPLLAESSRRRELVRNRHRGFGEDTAGRKSSFKGTIEDRWTRTYSTSW